MSTSNPATWASDLSNLLQQAPDPTLAQRLERVLAAWNQNTATGGDSWQAYTLADAYLPRPPMVYAVAGLLELPSLNIVYGAPGCLKSFLLADLAVCVAAGVPWLPPLPKGDGPPAKATSQGPVVWIDFDNGKRRTDERFDALGQARGLLPETTPLVYYSMPSPWLDAGELDAVGDLADRVLARAGRLVVVDNLGAVTGRADENSAEMVGVLSNLRRLAEMTGAAVVVIHHQRKNTGTTSRAGDSLRGHSSIEAALDLALLVERNDGSDEVDIRCTKTRGVAVPPFGAMFTYDHKPSSTDLAQAMFYGALSQEAREDADIEDAILSALQVHGPLNQSALWKEVKTDLPDAGRNRTYAAAKRLVKSGEINSTTGKHGAIDYARV